MGVGALRGSHHLKERSQPSHVASNDWGAPNAKLQPPNNETIIVARKKCDQLLIAAFKTLIIMTPQ